MDKDPTEVDPAQPRGILLDQLAKLNARITTRSTPLNVVRDVVTKRAGIKPLLPTTHQLESRNLLLVNADRTKDQIRRVPNHVELPSLGLASTSNSTEENHHYLPFYSPHIGQIPLSCNRNQPEPPTPQTPHQPSLISLDSHNNEDHGAFFRFLQVSTPLRGFL